MKKLGEAFGALTLVGGLTWVLLNLHGPTMGLDALVGSVIALGSLVLLMPHRFELPGRLTAAVAAGAALIGTAASLLHSAVTTGGMYVYVTWRGWPFGWLYQGAAASDLTTAERLAATAGRNLDVIPLVADLLVWAYAGIVVVAVAVPLRRTARRPRESVVR